MNKQRTKQEKGITLIALIITIVVLLILATVAIRAVQGNGILAYAKNARDDYQKAQSEEEAMLQNYLDKLNENTSNNNDNSEKITLEPGLYKQDGTTVSWEQLTSMEYQTITSPTGETGAILNVDENGVLSGVWDVLSISCLSSEYLHGKLVIPDEVKSIGNSAFYGCQNLTSVIISNNVTSIGDGAFYGCKNLTSVTISDSVTSIGKNAFGYCENLETIEVSSNISSVGFEAFGGTPWLTAKQNENPLVVVGSVLIDASKCSGAVKIPEGVKTINDECFGFWNENVTSIEIPDGVITIDGAFEGCANLTSIIIPSTVTSIDTSTFRNCDKLTTIYYSGTATGAPWEAVNATILPNPYES